MVHFKTFQTGNNRNNIFFVASASFGYINGHVVSLLLHYNGHLHPVYEVQRFGRKRFHHCHSSAFDNREHINDKSRHYRNLHCKNI